MRCGATFSESVRSCLIYASVVPGKDSESLLAILMMNHIENKISCSSLASRSRAARCRYIRVGMMAVKKKYRHSMVLQLAGVPSIVDSLKIKQDDD